MHSAAFRAFQSIISCPCALSRMAGESWAMAVVSTATPAYQLKDFFLLEAADEAEDLHARVPADVSDVGIRQPTTFTQSRH